MSAFPVYLVYTRRKEGGLALDSMGVAQHMAGRLARAGGGAKIGISFFFKVYNFSSVFANYVRMC